MFDLLDLFEFCVLTEEFRNGKKIGEVRRDFQLKVIDCPTNNAPQSFLREMVPVCEEDTPGNS